MLQNSDTGHTNFLKWSLGLSVILTPSLLFVPAWQSASGRNNERSVWSHLDSNRKLWCLCCAVPEERASSCDPGRGIAKINSWAASEIRLTVPGAAEAGFSCVGKSACQGLAASSAVGSAAESVDLRAAWPK